MKYKKGRREGNVLEPDKSRHCHSSHSMTAQQSSGSMCKSRTAVSSEAWAKLRDWASVAK